VYRARQEEFQMAYVNPSPLLPSGPSADTAPSLELRVKVRWSALELDAALASGADPASSEELALRAEQLAARGKREQFARSIDDLLRIAARNSGPELPTTRAPVSAERVGANRSQLFELRNRMLGPGPHSSRGLAQVSLLLEGSDSPLYRHALSGDLLPRMLDEILLAFHAEDRGDESL
jgi:hypothetical protein